MDACLSSRIKFFYEWRPDEISMKLFHNYESAVQDSISRFQSALKNLSIKLKQRLFHDQGDVGLTKEFERRVLALRKGPLANPLTVSDQELCHPLVGARCMMLNQDPSVTISTVEGAVLQQLFSSCLLLSLLHYGVFAMMGRVRWKI